MTAGGAPTAAPPGKPRATEGPASRPGSEIAAMRRGAWLREYWASNIGKKVVVATTGAILAVYVQLHALGNLKALQGSGDGSPAIDHYAEWLRTVGGPAIPREGVLWTLRTVLLVALVLHVTGITQLYLRNRRARPPQHRKAMRLGRSIASSAMLLGGVLLLAFVIFHILQFTAGTIEVTPINEGTVYANLYYAFQKWYFVVIYVGAVTLLGLHLLHGLWSVTQTAGWDTPNRNATIRRAASVTSVLVVATFAAVPIAFWTGILGAPL